MAGELERLKAAAATKPRDAVNQREIKHGDRRVVAAPVPALIEVNAGDLSAAAAAVAAPDEIVAALAKGAAACKPDEPVCVQACDLHHLLDKAGG